MNEDIFWEIQDILDGLDDVKDILRKATGCEDLKDGRSTLRKAMGTLHELERKLIIIDHAVSFRIICLEERENNE